MSRARVYTVNESRYQEVCPASRSELFHNAEFPLGTLVLDSYNADRADRMIDSLEQYTSLPSCDATVGPFSVFRLGVVDKWPTPSPSNEEVNRDSFVAQQDDFPQPQPLLQDLDTSLDPGEI